MSGLVIEGVAIPPDVESGRAEDVRGYLEAHAKSPKALEIWLAKYRAKLGETQALLHAAREQEEATVRAQAIGMPAEKAETQPAGPEG